MRMMTRVSAAAAVGAFALGGMGLCAAKAADMAVEQGQAAAPPGYYGQPPAEEGYGYPPPAPPLVAYGGYPPPVPVAYYGYAPRPFAVVPGPYYVRGPYWRGYGYGFGPRFGYGYGLRFPYGYGPRFAYGYGRWGRGYRRW